MASEGKARDVIKEWVGTGLRTEEIPASVVKGKQVVVVRTPWCYIYNLVGYVLKYLNDLKSTIPADEIHLKFGGDYGGGSFKTSFQVANVLHLNQQIILLFSV